MVVDGLIDEVTADTDPETDERRRSYGLTSFGREVAEAEAARLAEQVEVAVARGLLKGKRVRRGVSR
jgi:hypothetical protein